MTLDLYETLCGLVRRLEVSGVRCCGSFFYDPTCVMVDIWRADGSVGAAPVPMPLAVMPSVLARRIEAAR